MPTRDVLISTETVGYTTLHIPNEDCEAFCSLLYQGKESPIAEHYVYYDDMTRIAEYILTRM